MMKKQILIIALLVTCSLLSAYSQPIVKQNSKNVINRTAALILETQKLTAESEKFSGDFKRAITHQTYAVSLFNEGRYNMAICHSLKAREFAKKYIETNEVVFPVEYEIKESEIPDLTMPSDSQLEEDVAKFNGLYRSVSEQKLVVAKLIGVDIID